VPNFVVAIWLVLVLAVGLGGADRRLAKRAGRRLEDADHARPSPCRSHRRRRARYTPLEPVEVLHAEYVRTARATGLRRRMLWSSGHALKNALIR